MAGADQLARRVIRQAPTYMFMRDTGDDCGLQWHGNGQLRRRGCGEEAGGRRAGGCAAPPDIDAGMNKTPPSLASTVSLPPAALPPPLMPYGGLAHIVLTPT
eukprot:354287-Chlamydomonas_euryale.AAC.3